MEGAGVLSSAGYMKVEEAVTDSTHEASKSENPVHLVGSTAEVASPVSVAVPDMDFKKKRGRPRKYAPDGSHATALSPMPISSSSPLLGEFSSWKRGRGRPFESVKKQFKLEPDSSGERIAYSVGANFTPHIITINAGEDVSTKILSFSQQGSRAICVLSANGAISNVTIRQPNSSGGTLTYEGRFEILSLTGSFMPTENGVTRSRSGGMSVSLAGPDGRVVGGGLAGLLVAASPVQVVVGSFLPGHLLEQKAKKQRMELVSHDAVASREADNAAAGFMARTPPAPYGCWSFTSCTQQQGHRGLFTSEDKTGAVSSAEHGTPKEAAAVAAASSN